MVYGSQFNVKAPAGAELDPARLTATIQDWVSSWYVHWQHHPIEFPKPGTELKPDLGHSISCLELRTSTGEWSWEVDWRYPDPNDATLTLQIHSTVAKQGADVEFSIGLARESQDFRVAPSQFEFKLPLIVKRLLKEYDCFVGGRAVTTFAEEVDAVGVPRLVDEVVFNANRALPVIVVTRSNLGAELSADPSLLADNLGGLAEVYVVSDRTATFALTDKVGRELSCYNGAVRIYWPGATMLDDPRRHTLYLPETLLRIRQEGKSVESLIVGKVAGISALRYTGGTIASAVGDIASLEDERRVEGQIADLKADVQRGGSTKASLLERVHALEHLDRERSKRIKSLEAEVLRLRRGLATNDAETLEGGKAHALLPPDVGAEPKVESVDAALTRARAEFSDHLVVLRSAIDSAGRSHSRLAQESYRGLQAIREVAYDYFLGKDVKTGMGETFEKAFRRRGFSYHLKDSETTTGKFGAQRTFPYKGVPLLFEKHLTIGGGDRQDPVQIYFHVDDQERKFVIGYCGMHLDYSGART